MNIDFVFDNEVENFENNYEQDFTAIIEQALKTLGIEDDVEVSCVLVDDERIHEINREYRHIDRSTDVISFAMEDNDQFYVEGMPRTLGDIFISVDHAKKQAEEYGHSLRREMCFLFTHGILHLLGYDHMTDEQEKEMFGLQDQILGALNIEGRVKSL
jgi:probable rRNA maturation factor